MAKAHYKFNPETLEYEAVKTPLWVKALRVFGFLSAAAVFSVIIISISFQYLDSPYERKLKQEIDRYDREFTQLSAEFEKLKGTLTDLESRDEKIYREIFGAPMPKSLRAAGIGGSDRYTRLEGLTHSEALKGMYASLDNLSRKMYIQSKSYDELVALARKKSEMLASIPAIQPVANKELKRVASGFGYRIDPIYRTKKFHQGMDFSAHIGTSVYATGDGVIEKIERKRWGYGTHIVINHGFGYKTRYAHLSQINVSRGQKVKRGEVIGLVGSTGKSTAPHLHYEVLKNGKAVNPANYYYNDLTPEEYEKMLELASSANQSFD